ncbi:MAG: hypothetical protein IKZ45_00615 [Fibrobacter sp.]|nr:hypothetical protein [Fibrobacter sp.]
MDRRGGFVLGLVLVLILSLTILFGCLLASAGGLSRQVSRYEQKVQALYDAESAIIANLAGVPDGFFAGLPPVSADVVGPWGRVCASPRSGAHPVPANTVHPAPANLELCAEYGTRYSRLRFDDWYAAMSQYRASLRESITAAMGLRVLSGNRRFFRLDSSVAFHIADGDLLLDLDTRVSSAAFLVDGSAQVKGRASFDTLRIYAAGEVGLGGDVSVAHLEVYSGASLEVRSSFRFTGLLFARDQVTIRERARAGFPSVAVALGSGDNRVQLQGRAAFSGVLASPGGALELDRPDSLRGAAFPGDVRDSAFALLPAFFDGEPVVFRRSVQ